MRRQAIQHVTHSRQDDIDDVDVWSTWRSSYASDISDGVTDPKQIKGTWGMRPAPVESVKTLDTALASGDIARHWSRSRRATRVRGVKKALADYRDMAGTEVGPRCQATSS